MLKTLFSASLVAIGSLLAAIPAHAISFTWQFTPDAGPTGANPYVVKGTIDGLVIGSNSGAGITATVTDTPTGDYVGTNFTYVNSSLGGAPFDVDAGGNVTFADALFTSTNSDVLVFGGYGFGGELPRLGDSPIAWTTSSVQTTFSSAPTPVPFDFEPTSAVVILGGIFAANKLRKKLVKK
jgi:hypothetical protein